MAWCKLEFCNMGGIHGIYQVIEKGTASLRRCINAKCHTRTESFGYRFFQRVWVFLLIDFAWIFFRADSVSQALGYIGRMVRYRDWWSLFDGSIYTLGLEVSEFHILFWSVLVLVLVDCLRYFYKETLDVFLMKQWIVFRWGVLFGLILACLVFGCYGPGFASAQFVYLQF